MSAAKRLAKAETYRLNPGRRAAENSVSRPLITGSDNLGGSSRPSLPKPKCQKNEPHALNQEEHSENNWDRECRRDRRTEQQQTDQEVYRP
jgi:hypothetical protein